uniref:T-complex protein 1 subunit beta n=1 Tax=Culex pipiens TaxID=7175 RepID=A0A8D8KTK3_CULPI
MRLAWNDFRDGVGVRVAAMLSEAEKLLEQKFHPQTSAAKQAPKLCAGCCLEDSFLDEGFLLDKKPVVHKSKRIDNIKILIANTSMDTDKIDGEDCRAGGRREGEDEGQGEPHPGPQLQRVHQPSADLQLPGAAVCRRRSDGHRARRFRRNRTVGAGDGR